MESLHTSSHNMRRIFEDLCRGGLTPEESLATLRNDGFSQADLTGLYQKPGPVDLAGLVPEKKFTISRGPREAQRNWGASSSCAPHSADLFALSIIWEQADARPWHMLAVVIAGGASLVALTAWKLARYTWRKIRR